MSKKIKTSEDPATIKRQRGTLIKPDDVLLARWEKQKRAAAARVKEMSTQGRDIKPLPPIKNRKRRKRCLASLREFCETYFPESFNLEWSPDHLTVITKLEIAIRSGGQFAIAMPRGFGKTTLCEAACIWALFAGYHQFVCLVAAEAGLAVNMLDSIKVELETNELLLADFPEIVYPIHKMESITQRTKGQTLNGESTRMEWGSDCIVLPTVKGSIASGGIIRTAGLGASIRGMKFKRPDGRPVRPSLVILDDPQTDDTARSVSQIQKRIELINGAVLNLAGPGKKIAAIMPCTVIQQNDMADQVLDPKLYPTWQGERMKMVYKWPDRMDLWEQYTQIRRDSFQSGGKGEISTEFYRQNRVEMDRGAVVAWPQYYKPDELSALQCAMNLRFRDPASERAFMAEQQNEPLPPLEEMLAGQVWDFKVAGRLNGCSRGVIPAGAGILTAYVDLQKTVLYWMVCAWENDFTGYIVDYGTYPNQLMEYFTLAGIKRTLQMEFKGATDEGALFGGLTALTKSLLLREWRREDGASLRIQRCPIDANWQTELVYKFCRQSPFGAILTPSHGRHFGASSTPMSDYIRKPNDRLGLNWRIAAKVGTRAIRHLLWDRNFWNTFVTHRFAASMGDSGCITFFGRDDRQHSMLREHLLAEYPIKTEGRGRKVEEWKLRAAGRDNHWWDCLSGCTVAASMEGAVLAEHTPSGTLRQKNKIIISKIPRKKIEVELK